MTTKLTIVCGQCAFIEPRSDHTTSKLYQCAIRPPDGTIEPSLPQLRALAGGDMPITCPGSLRRSATFHSMYIQHRDRIGQKFTIVRVITKADERHDEEVLPMFVIRFEDGVEIEAFPEEIEHVEAHDQ